MNELLIVISILVIIGILLDRYMWDSEKSHSQFIGIGFAVIVIIIASIQITEKRMIVSHLQMGKQVEIKLNPYEHPYIYIK